MSIESSEVVKERFLSLIEMHKGIIYKVANAYCRDVEDRKDLVQEIVIQLWRSFDKYDAQYKWSTWMYRIALNVAISFLRKEKRRKDAALSLTANIIEVPECVFRHYPGIPECASEENDQPMIS